MLTHFHLNTNAQKQYQPLCELKLNPTLTELGPAQPQLVSHKSQFMLKLKNNIKIWNSKAKNIGEKKISYQTIRLNKTDKPYTI